MPSVPVTSKRKKPWSIGTPSPTPRRNGSALTASIHPNASARRTRWPGPRSFWPRTKPPSSTGPGPSDFGLLRDFLNGLERRQMQALLGTATFIPPQWLVAAHPETLVQLLPGLAGHPMSRHSPCLNHPLYREACQRFLRALG